MLRICAPIPSLITCVKSLETIESLPPLCNAPSIRCPVAASPNVVTFCTYGERAVIQTRWSSGPHPGSSDAYAPAVGLLVPLAFAGPKSPLKPFTDCNLKPVPFLK